MKNIKRIIALLIAGIFIIGAFAVNISADESDGLYHGTKTDKVMWDASGMDGYTQTRIPGIVVTKNDTVIVYCEARDTTDTKGTAGSGGDWCRMDIFIQRSEDGGKTFGEPIYIARGGEGNYGITVNNPVMIVGNDNTLHMLFNSDYGIKAKGGMYYTKSTDDGKTWSTPTNIMTDAINNAYDCIAFGPTHGICTSNGVLMTAMWAVPADATKDEHRHGGSKAFVFFSKDNGATWEKTSNQIAQNNNETALAELSDGSIMANSRGSINNFNNGKRLRSVTICNNFNPNSTSQQWSGTTYPPELLNPEGSGCCGSILGVDVEGLPYMLLAVNCQSENARELVTVSCSLDDGVTYSKTLQISPTGQGGYSDIAVDSTGKAYVLWEINFGQKMMLTTFSLEDVFCNDEKEMNTDMELVFDNSQTAKMIENQSNINGELKDGAFHVETKKSSAPKSFEIDFSDYTRMLNMTDYKYMMFKVRVDKSTPAETEFEFYFRSPQMTTNNPARSASTVVENDGEWHTVFVDLSGKGIRGTLQNMQVRMESTGAKTDIVVADILGVAFFKTAEETEDFEFTLTPVEDNATKEDTTPDSNTSNDAAENGEEEEEKGGCGSSIAGGFALVTMAAVGACVAVKKKRK